MTITIIGAGYVGLVTGVCLADAGFDVVCVDRDEQKITKLNQGELPFYEPGLKELMTKNKKRLHFVETRFWRVSHNEQETLHPNVSTIDVFFICVGTPPKPDGSADMTAYWSVLDDIVETRQQRVSGELYVINKSTVPVGTARKAQEILGHGFTAISMPEFLREGKAVHDFQHPDRVVIGTSRDVPALQDIFSLWSCPILTMSWESAELTKYAANAFLATKISFINEIAQLCEKIGANVDDVAEAIGKDPRIGSAFLKAGIGYGGSCFPKDVRALASLAGNFDYNFQLLKSTIEVNQSQREFVLQKIVETSPWGVSVNRETPTRGVSVKGRVFTIAVLGIAFKGDTDDVRESSAVWLIEQLLERGATVKAYDPQATLPSPLLHKEDTFFSPSSPHKKNTFSPPVLHKENTHLPPSLNKEKALLSPLLDKEDTPFLPLLDKEGVGGGIILCTSSEECMKDADMVVIATEWEEFRTYDWQALKSIVKTPILIDTKNLFIQNEVKKLRHIGWKYGGIGRDSKE